MNETAGGERVGALTMLFDGMGSIYSESSEWEPGKLDNITS